MGSHHSKLKEKILSNETVSNVDNFLSGIDKDRELFTCKSDEHSLFNLVCKYYPVYINTLMNCKHMNRDILFTKTVKENTCLHLLAYYNPPYLDEIINKCNNFGNPKQLLLCQNRAGNTFLHMLAMYNPHYMSLILNNSNIPRELLNIENNDRENVIKILAEKGPDNLLSVINHHNINDRMLYCNSEEKPTILFLLAEHHPEYLVRIVGMYRNNNKLLTKMNNKKQIFFSSLLYNENIDILSHLFNVLPSSMSNCLYLGDTTYPTLLFKISESYPEYLYNIVEFSKENAKLLLTTNNKKHLFVKSLIRNKRFDILKQVLFVIPTYMLHQLFSVCNINEENLFQQLCYSGSPDMIQFVLENNMITQKIFNNHDKFNYNCLFFAAMYNPDIFEILVNSEYMSQELFDTKITTLYDKTNKRASLNRYGEMMFKKRNGFNVFEMLSDQNPEYMDIIFNCKYMHDDLITDEAILNIKDKHKLYRNTMDQIRIVEENEEEYKEIDEKIKNNEKKIQERDNLVSYLKKIKMVTENTSISDFIKGINNFDNLKFRNIIVTMINVHATQHLHTLFKIIPRIKLQHILDLKDNREETLFYKLCSKGDKSIVEYLLKHDLVFNSTFSKKDKYGYNCLTVAILYNPSIFELIINNKMMTKEMLTNKVARIYSTEGKSVHQGRIYGDILKKRSGYNILEIVSNKEPDIVESVLNCKYFENIMLTPECLENSKVKNTRCYEILLDYKNKNISDEVWDKYLSSTKPKNKTSTKPKPKTKNDKVWLTVNNTETTPSKTKTYASSYKATGYEPTAPKPEVEINIDSFDQNFLNEQMMMLESISNEYNKFNRDLDRIIEESKKESKEKNEGKLEDSFRAYTENVKSINSTPVTIIQEPIITIQEPVTTIQEPVTTIQEQVEIERSEEYDHLYNFLDNKIKEIDDKNNVEEVELPTVPTNKPMRSTPPNYSDIYNFPAVPTSEPKKSDDKGSLVAL